MRSPCWVPGGDPAVLDEYLADYESRKGPVSESARQRARQVFDEVFAEEAEWPAAG
ncbi:hypothetical protein [Streptomyces sp. AF1A]|jgi:hypothetical protein|uniref:hypothetical protein n=1 Tax=Streptomyces sp. AF1A TaxID=3394350 RepID=UPI0039BCED3E